MPATVSEADRKKAKSILPCGVMRGDDPDDMDVLAEAFAEVRREERNRCGIFLDRRADEMHAANKISASVAHEIKCLVWELTTTEPRP